ncbi:MAG: 50S ribosomal protein L44e [Candidatus Diapherotrites archaeon]|nr:50S ribosomal protein L44e [Candidatus Diapherotrites archaeon]
MEFPKKMSRYCKKCKRHTEHNIKEYKGGRARKMAKGTRKHERNNLGYGGKYQAVAHKKKLNKKPTFSAICNVCGAKKVFTIGKRLKKPQLV